MTWMYPNAVTIIGGKNLTVRHIPGVMTRELVKILSDGRKAYAPAEELEKATSAVSLVPICMYDYQEHGDLELPPEEILGWAHLRFEDKKVKSDLYFDETDHNLFHAAPKVR